MNLYYCAPISDFGSDILDARALEGGVVYTIGYGHAMAPRDLGEAHGYRGVWRNSQGMGNHGALCLEAIDPNGRQAALLRRGYAAHWEAVRTDDGRTWDEIALAGGIVLEWRVGESRVPGARVSQDWEVAVQSCGFPRAGYFVRLKPRTERAREIIRLARQRAVEEIAPIDPGVIRRAVIAGESRAKGHDARVLATAALIPCCVWQGEMPRSNAAIPRWMERRRIAAPCDRMSDLLAARDIALAMKEV